MLPEMRRTKSKCIKIFILMIAVGYLLLQLLGSTQIYMKKTNTEDLSMQDNERHQNESAQKLSNQALNYGDVTSKKMMVGKASSSLSGERIHRLPNETIPAQSVSTLIRADATVKTENLSAILNQMFAANSDEKIYNEDLFGAVSNETIVIVIQVHNRVQYLRQLIKSLSLAKDIQQCLLVFSHDYWDESINFLVRSIDFTKTMQIFYPYSIQTHPNEFPGESPNDCPRNAKRDQAQRLQCTNAEWPDLYGHYREAKFTQTRHHWWWKANQIFDKLNATKNFNGLVVFLEEDHFVSEDIISVLRLTDIERKTHHPDCDIICMGTYLKSYNYNRDHKTIELTRWVSAKHNMGMAFTRDLWTKIYACREHFCNFDDYNWDWSLEHISQTCLPNNMQVLLVKGPRVFHIGECGVHHKKVDCDATMVVQKVKDILSRASNFLFPKDLLVVETSTKKKKGKIFKGNGGWGDKRDRDLCMAMSQNKTRVSLHNDELLRNELMFYPASNQTQPKHRSEA